MIKQKTTNVVRIETGANISIKAPADVCLPEPIFSIFGDSNRRQLHKITYDAAKSDPQARRPPIEKTLLFG